MTMTIAIRAADLVMRSKPRNLALMAHVSTTHSTIRSHTSDADAPQQDCFLLRRRQVLRPLHERAHLLCNHVPKGAAPTRICVPYGVHELFRQLTSADFRDGPSAAYREVVQDEENEEVEQERVEEDEGARVLVAQEEAPTRQGDLQGAKGLTGLHVTEGFAR
jgi:hypothetical protein